jgi:hypothetical protein
MYGFHPAESARSLHPMESVAPELAMNTYTPDFTLEVEGVKGFCPAGEKYAQQMRNHFSGFVGAQVEQGRASLGCALAPDGLVGWCTKRSDAVRVADPE